MTRDEILNMEAGREMDALVSKEYDLLRYFDCGDFRPTSDIVAAWEVVEKMMEDGDVFIEYWSDGEWFVCNTPMGARDNDSIKAHCDGRKTGKPSAPLAICRAALLAVMQP